MLHVIGPAHPTPQRGPVMAKAAQKSGSEESIMGYFRPLLQANPKLLKGRTRNDELYKKWLDDHPGYTEVPEQVKNGLSNLKSTMRRQRKIQKRKRAEKAASNAATVAAPAPVKRAKRTAGPLEQLEEQIDEGMALARNLDRDGLGEVIDLLRSARNRVVVTRGR